MNAPRHARSAALPAVLLAALALGGCTTDASQPVDPSPSPSSSAASGVDVTGADDALAAAVRTRYAGQSGVRAQATTGTWEKVPVAVVTADNDVTLLVDDDGWEVVGGWWPSLDEPDPELGATPRFVLAIGADARKGKPLTGTRADTLQIVGIDGSGGGGVVGVARDMWASMPGGGNAKINAAFSRGGGDAQAEAVRRLSGLPISGYVATGFGGFEKIVDELGGIPIVIPKAMKGKASGVDLEAGAQTLTGKQALAYARERKSLPDGDFGRSRHQGDLVLAAGVAARLAGVGSVPRLLTSVSAHSRTDLTAAQALTFAAAFHRLEPDKVGHAVAKGGFGTSADGQSVVLLDGASRKVFTAFADGRL